MEKAKEFLKLSSEESESVSRLTIHPHRVGQESSFYEDFAIRGLRVDRVEPGFVACTFRVPPRLQIISLNSTHFAEPLSFYIFCFYLFK